MYPTNVDHQQNIFKIGNPSGEPALVVKKKKNGVFVLYFASLEQNTKITPKNTIHREHLGKGKDSILRHRAVALLRKERKKKSATKTRIL